MSTKRTRAPGKERRPKHPVGAVTRNAAPTARPLGMANEHELLDQSRMQWQFGDWESLTALDWRVIENHPHRAELALLAGTAHQQLGDSAVARQYVGQAIEWGCDKRHVAQVLISSLHNTLARAAAVRGEQSRALSHFRQSVDGVNGDPRLACQARSVREVARLNLLDQAANIIRRQQRPGVDQPFNDQPGRLAFQPGLSGAGTDREGSSGRGRPVIVIAGMRHSGSTALFNIVRLALEQKGMAYTSFYSEGKDSELLNDPEPELLLVKTHELRDDVLSRADVILTTRRDLRDTVASANRRNFPLLRQLNSVVEYAKYNRSLHDLWLPYSDCEFVYESFMADPVTEAQRLLHHIGLDDVDVETICGQVAALPTDQYGTTLLSPIHITDPQRVRSFQDSLDANQLAKINIEHAGWLQRYGYGPATDGT